MSKSHKSSLERFLSEFPSNAKSWAQATDELPDLYVWLAEELHLPPVGRANCRTPSQWNTKYKAAIRAAVKKLNADQRRRFLQRFAGWLREGNFNE